MTTFSDMLYQLGGVPALYGIPFSKKSKYYFVDPVNGNNSNPGTDLAYPLAGIETAYAKTVSGQNDVVFYIGGTTANTLAAAVDWSNSYTHLIGICAPTMIAQRSRIFQTSTLTGASPLFTVSGSGCIFKNFYIFQGVNDATSLINVSVTGGRNYFENVHFAGGGHTAMAIDNCASLQVTGDENTFKNCVAGVDTIPLATGGNVLRFDGSAKRNVFDDCMFNVLAGHAGARLVEVVDSTAVDMVNFFRNCLFISNSVNKAITMASAFEIPALSGATALIYMHNCHGMGFTDWDDDNRGLLYFDTGTITAGGNSGIAQVSNST